MSTTHTPVNAAEADALRAYVPTQTLLAINVLSKAESAEIESRWRERDETTKAIKDAKERMRKDRALIKEMERKQKAYFEAPIYQRTDAARSAAWAAAKVARETAITAGETPKIETLAECNVRLARAEGGK